MSEHIIMIGERGARDPYAGLDASTLVSLALSEGIAEDAVAEAEEMEEEDARHYLIGLLEDRE